MKIFRVLVGGSHLMMDVDGEHRYMGCFVTRFVKATDTQLACRSAIAEARAEAGFDGLILNQADDPPLFCVEESEEVFESDIPDDEPGFVLFRDDAESDDSLLSPPPYLVIRPGVSFWVDPRPLSRWTATSQALNEGCFRDVFIYEGRGDLWRVIDARFTQPISRAGSLLLWQQQTVQLELMRMPQPSVRGIRDDLVAILDASAEVSEHAGEDRGKRWEILERAARPTELIRSAESLQIMAFE
ncbi:MAG: hypothetical protein ACK58L_13960 [Planctomycetota bacterium]